MISIKTFKVNHISQPRNKLTLQFWAVGAWYRPVSSCAVPHSPVHRWADIVGSWTMSSIPLASQLPRWLWTIPFVEKTQTGSGNSCAASSSVHYQMQKIESNICRCQNFVTRWKVTVRLGQDSILSTRHGRSFFLIHRLWWNWMFVWMEVALLGIVCEC